MTGEDRQTRALWYGIAAVVCGLVAGGVFSYHIIYAVLKIVGLM